MSLVTRLNGQEMQRATTDMMIHSIPRQIAYISTFIPLQAGDVIVTGTPGGVGNKRNPQVFMKPGDVVEIEVDAIGILRNTIRDEVVWVRIGEAWWGKVRLIKAKWSWMRLGENTQHVPTQPSRCA